MRVIGGQQRGRKLRAPHGMQTRPLTARVRASIFSRLASRDAVDGVRVLDLFAGSGSFGLEALSRGASEVVFVDRSRAAAAAIQYNLSQLALLDRARVVNTEIKRALAELGAAGERFQLVFVDAPFDADSTAEVLALIATLGLLAPDGMIVTRQFHRTPTPMVALMECGNVVKIGDHRIALYRPVQRSDGEPGCPHVADRVR
ncbi:MAG: 16S rRNA (guanine(966)-N(2))-methyltransferase RsmD [Deltaproteobacteria bacterium]|nr:16S rRNA (guanine(966)-N(2))-methyltransferase RsmD [Deltaproteobacteria bacterium]